MNLYEMVSDAQGGQAMANLGRQFGLSDEQSEQALRSLLPAFSTGLKRNTQSPVDLSAFLKALASGQHERAYDDGDTFADRGVQRQGNDVLGHVFGSKDVSRAVADRAAQQTGISSEILKAMLPYIASIIMGALFKQGQNPIGDILGQILGGQSPATTPGSAPYGQGDNPFGPLSDILKGGTDQAGRGGPANLPASGTDIFGQMFDADGDGSWADAADPLGVSGGSRSEIAPPFGGVPAARDPHRKHGRGVDMPGLRQGPVDIRPRQTDIAQGTVVQTGEPENRPPVGP
jgi:hypothetical protein